VYIGGFAPARPTFVPPRGQKSPARFQLSVFQRFNTIRTVLPSTVPLLSETMRVAHFEQVFGSLQRAKVRFLVVGGVAVVAHGVIRYTNDLDLVFAFDEDNLRKGVQALEELGFKASIPITAAAFADPENRRRWAHEKNMLVFQLALFAEDDLPIDIFIEPPFDFEQEYVNASRCELAPDLFVPVVSVDRLIAMKRQAGRPRDLEDVTNLERLRSKKP
jgi:hypothetical protein